MQNKFSLTSAILKLTKYKVIVSETAFKSKLNLRYLL